MDESVNSIKSTDLDDCFSDLKQLGNHTQRIFINLIDKAQSNMIDRFKEICEQHNVESLISQFNGENAFKSESISSVKESIQEIQSRAKRKEIEWIQSDCDRLEKRIRMLRSSSSKKNDALHSMLDKQHLDPNLYTQ